MSRVGRRRSIVQNIFINTSKYNLKREVDRYATFVENEFTNNYVSAEELALFGFYFHKRPDIVKCAFCYVEIGDFEEGDTPLTEHLKFSPNCPLLVKRRPTGNVAMNEEAFKERVPMSSYDICGSCEELNSSEHEYPQFKVPQKRLNSFETWPVGIKQKPRELVDAGFFYSGQSDLVICFSCGLYLNHWESTDNPWVEHKNLATKSCNHLLLNQETVEREERKYEEFKKLRATEEQITTLNINEQSEATVKDGMDLEKETDFENVCKICLERKSQIIFLPCGHVAVCGICVSGIDEKCPICRTKIEKRQNVFYS